VSLGSFKKRMTAGFGAVATGALALGMASGQALAATPKPWQLGLPDPVTPIAEQMQVFHDYWLMPIITVITIFVLALLLITCFKFRESANPTPSKRTHNSLLEVLWTGIPVLILVVLAFPSLKLLYATDDVADADMTVKIVGHQWYWEYQYLDENFRFDAFLAARSHEEAQEMGVERLMTTDNLVVLPSDTKIRLQMTSADVLHNWSLSDFGVRVDTVPGRLNESWTQINKGSEGMYYGFCSELCGTDHAYMPIAVKVVSKQEYQRWLVEAKQEFAAIDPTLENDSEETDTAEAGAVDQAVKVAADTQQ